MVPAPTRALLAVLLAACAAPPLPRMHSPLPCCAQHEDIVRLDGLRVMLEGIYTLREDRVWVVADSGDAVRLEPRPADEPDRLTGRHVRVTGRLHARHIGASLDRIESIEAL